MTLLERVSGEGPRRILLFEDRSDAAESPDERAYRVWCMEIFDQEPWSLLEDAFYEDGKIRLEFPSNHYYGMPRFLALEKHVEYQLGGSVRLYREDGSVHGGFQVRERLGLTRREFQKREGALAASSDGG
jgi:hypothetical protein